MSRLSSCTLIHQVTMVAARIKSVFLKCLLKRTTGKKKPAAKMMNVSAVMWGIKKKNLLILFKQWNLSHNRTSAGVQWTIVLPYREPGLLLSNMHYPYVVGYVTTTKGHMGVVILAVIMDFFHPTLSKTTFKFTLTLDSISLTVESVYDHEITIQKAPRHEQLWR